MKDNVGEPPVLSVQGLSVRIGGEWALREIGLDVPRRRVMALIGPTGCGKTVLLRALNRTLDLAGGGQVTGRVALDGDDVYAPSFPLPSLRRRVGLVQAAPLPFQSSIYENLAWGARINGFTGDLDELVESALRRAGLWDEAKDRLSAPAMSLTVGQRQRLCIARALAVEPDVLMLDEPCLGLDPLSAGRVEDAIAAIGNEIAVLLSTANLHQARRLSDWTACFAFDEEAAKRGARTGTLTEVSPTDVLFTNPRDKRTEDFITGRVPSG